jgi:tRNA (guanine-N7-)-methyltransferase
LACLSKIISQDKSQMAFSELLFEVVVRRIRRLPMEELAPYCLPDPTSGETPSVIDWNQLFGNNNPVEIEVGFGKGLFLRSASEAQPQRNFLGIEIVRKYQLFVATRLVPLKRTNIRVACGDAGVILRDRVQTASVSALHIYFPDPWWKKRHKKRRVFRPDFAATTSRILFAGGKFHIATDVEEYFGVMMEIVRPMTQFRELEAPSANQPQHDMDYLTNFERKFRKEGRPIYRALFERTEAPSAKDDSSTREE